jgi:hypothetical protein
MQQNLNCNKAFFFIAFLASTLVTFAQEGSTKRFNLGYCLGPVSSQMSGDGLSGFDKFGGTAGLSLRANISERSDLLLGMGFISKGSRAPLDTITRNVFAYRLNYIQIPITWQIHWNERINVHLSPYAAYLIHQSVMSNKNTFAVAEYGGQPAFNDWDFGINAGIGFVLSDNSSLVFEYGQSVVPIRPNPSQANQFSYYERGNYNSTVALMLLHYF